MPKSRRDTPLESRRTASADFVLEAERFLDHWTLGTWIPNIDLCETKENVTVRVELPGVDLADVKLSIERDILRVQGVKREPVVSQKLLCYYCVERRYGKFQREIHIDWVVDAQRSRAYLRAGVLTIELPKLSERRGVAFEIPITKI